MSIQAPKQFDKVSVNDYFTMFKLYATAVAKDLDDPKIKTEFMAGLILDNQKEFIRFGAKKPLTEIVDHLKRHESRSETRYVFGDIVQGDDSIILFYAKVRKYNALLNLDKERLRYNFIRGLNSKYQLEAELCLIIEPDISLKELVDRLSKLEALSMLRIEDTIF
jgi:hypothetical protein